MVQFVTLPQGGADQRQVAEVVRGIMDGKTNNTGSVTLATGGATLTTIYNERIGYDSVIILEANSASSSSMPLPYGAWQDSVDQVAANTTTAYPITFDTIDYENGVRLVSGSRITAGYSGLYNLQFSIQLSNIDNATQDVDIWFRVNGTDIPKSNSLFGLAPRKNATDPYHVIAAMNFFVELAKNDYVEVMWRPSNVLVTIDAKPAQTSPTRPTTPSAIVTMQYVSVDGYTSNIFTSPYISSQTRGSAVISHPANTTAGLTYKYIIVG
jgi:hypothetical protein